jgi:sulfur carrier protein
MTARSIRVNGEPRETAAATLVQLLRQLELAETTAGVAVAVNGAIVPRSDWTAQRLENGDRVDIVGAVQGG